MMKMNVRYKLMYAPADYNSKDHESLSYNNCVVYIFISLYFSCRQKHANNRKN